ncbi:MAG: tRNA guanosine(15) transglycosylase TgtA [Nitrosopumilus sp. D6]|nr:MAG: tRNA guanosine(15) transglycosylase TgtA [Nitrosopumilus sp. D6]
MFEITKSDLAGRTGVLHTNHGSVQTPAYVPVIHPARQTIPSERIRKMGFEMVITNAYITRKRFGDEATRRGIHEIINFNGAVMTDSGGYQVLEYGDVEVLPPEMAAFERGIMTDFGIPLDKPTGFGMPKKTAAQYVRHTLEVSRQTLQAAEDNGQIWIGPIQGGEHFDLVSKSAKGLVDAGFTMMALGSPVEFMESYEYGLLARMIITAKRQIPHSIPLHLFGAGHPLTIPLAVALGCDTFDSASYILYAKNQRYMTGDGTRYLKDISVFPCGCEVCSRYTPAELRQLAETERTDELAVHNLHAIKLEVDMTRQAIHEGRLWEYVMKKSRAHPRLYEIIRIMTGNGDFLAEGTPRFKDRAAFLYDRADQFRPEVQRYHEMVRRFKSKKKTLVIMPETDSRPGYLSGRYAHLAKKFGDSAQICQYSPHLGLVPIEISDIYPAAHHETARNRFEPAEFVEFGTTWKKFFENNSFEEMYYDKKDRFLEYFAKGTRDIKKKNLNKK